MLSNYLYFFSSIAYTAFDLPRFSFLLGFSFCKYECKFLVKLQINPSNFSLFQISSLTLFFIYLFFFSFQLSFVFNLVLPSKLVSLSVLLLINEVVMIILSFINEMSLNSIRIRCKTYILHPLMKQ